MSNFPEIKSHRENKFLTSLAAYPKKRDKFPTFYSPESTGI